MSIEIDIKFNNIIECANRILKFEKDSLSAQTDEEYEQILFFIDEQKMMMAEYTHIAPENIVPYVAGLNSLKNIIENEKDPKKKSEAELYLANLTNKLKLEVCKPASKESKFRNSQKSTIDFSITSLKEFNMGKESSKER